MSSLSFRIIWSPSDSMQLPNEPLILLWPDNWDDYTFKTSFNVSLSLDPKDDPVSIGAVKIGYVGQDTGRTLDVIDRQFTALNENWFSLGQDVDYYRNVRSILPDQMGDQFFRALRDVAFQPSILDAVKAEPAFTTSLLRSVSMSVLQGQFVRVIKRIPALTNFDFRYVSAANIRSAENELEFKVRAGSTPSTNLHVIVGRNGAGKTTLLNGMVWAIVHRKMLSPNAGGFLHPSSSIDSKKRLPEDYFSSVVSVSFSAFDKFLPPSDRPDRSKGTAYFYIGLKGGRSDNLDWAPPKSDMDLAEDLRKGLDSCLSQPAKKERWLSAIGRLQSDPNFKEMRLDRFASLERETAIKEARPLIEKMSSGHAIVLLTMTKLVDTVEEKTLVLMDEPESHLHPPLLSAFIRALADLLHDRNGVAIIATHSPVVVQEVPKSCVWKLTRMGTHSRTDRPERETFGENVGVLTREIFGLEVSESGFHDMLQKAVEAGGAFEDILQNYGGQLGYEAQAMLRSMISTRDSSRRGN